MTNKPMSTCCRCLKETDGIHTCTPSAGWRKLEKQRDELLAAAEAIEIDAEDCLDFDECTAIIVPIDAYHKLIEAIASVKGQP